MAAFEKDNREARDDEDDDLDIHNDQEDKDDKEGESQLEFEVDNLCSTSSSTANVTFEALLIGPQESVTLASLCQTLIPCAASWRTSCYLCGLRCSINTSRYAVLVLTLLRGR